MDIHFSYLSRRPEKSTLRIREVLGQESLVGSYGSQQGDVFHNYYHARRERTGLGPHYEFANARSGIEDIMAFTAEWGILIPPIPIIGGTLGAKQFEPWMHFYLFIEEWREAKHISNKFLTWLEAEGKQRDARLFNC